jgi:hypothetical protein
MSARGAGPGPARYTRPHPAFVCTCDEQADLKVRLALEPRSQHVRAGRQIVDDDVFLV